jgi:hypothetical protein
MCHSLTPSLSRKWKMLLKMHDKLSMFENGGFQLTIHNEQALESMDVFIQLVMSHMNSHTVLPTTTAETTPATPTKRRKSVTKSTQSKRTKRMSSSSALDSPPPSLSSSLESSFSDDVDAFQTKPLSEITITVHGFGPKITMSSDENETCTDKITLTKKRRQSSASKKKTKYEEDDDEEEEITSCDEDSEDDSEDFEEQPQHIKQPVVEERKRYPERTTRKRRFSYAQVLGDEEEDDSEEYTQSVPPAKRARRSSNTTINTNFNTSKQQLPPVEPVVSPIPTVTLKTTVEHVPIQQYQQQEIHHPIIEQQQQQQPYVEQQQLDLVGEEYDHLSCEDSDSNGSAEDDDCSPMFQQTNFVTQEPSHVTTISVMDQSELYDNSASYFLNMEPTSSEEVGTNDVKLLDDLWGDSNSYSSSLLMY